MAEYPTAIALSALNGANGFRLEGIVANDFSGYSVAPAGDVDGDGFADVIVGAYGANGVTGEGYVVFGKAGGFASAVDLSDLDGANGFRLNGIDANDFSGVSVSSAGDVNGDGIADLIVGAPKANGSAGESYVVFGKASGLGSALDLSGLNGGNGFRIDGIDASDQSGVSVSSAGDVNGDGFADVIVGAYRADGQAGESYVVFGKASGFTTNIFLSTLNGTNGFRLDGIDADDRSGRSVASAGDVNGDGFADVIVGASRAYGYTGESYVVFGKASGFNPSLDLSDLDGTNGFRLDGIGANQYSGRSVASAGDVNGDGFADLIVGAYGYNGFAGASYVVFGKASGFASNLKLSTLNGANGFRLTGIDAGDNSGHSVSSAGDVNGDGFADVIVGANLANGFAGESYVVFGTASGFPSNLTLSSLDGDNGFRLDGIDANDRSGSSVSGAGDVNADGFADLIVGAPNANGNSGESYVVFGFGAQEAVTRTGTVIANRINGGTGNDTIGGLGGNDNLIGREGNDSILGGLGNDSLDGGDGTDTLRGGLGNDLYLVDRASDVTSEAGGGGTDTVQASVTFTLKAGFENLTLTPTAAIDGTGNGRDNILTGNAAANRLDGGAGADTMRGGGGNDTFVVNEAGDRVIEAAGAGIDRVQSLVSRTLESGVENLELIGVSVINGTGNGLDNILIGNSRSNTMGGGAGADTMRGGGGNDVYGVDNTGDVVTEGAGAGVDSVRSSVTRTLEFGVENLTLTGVSVINGTGNGLDNILIGNDRSNTMGGGAGADTMRGGGGNDVYGVDNTGDVVTEGAGAGVDSVRSSVTRTLEFGVEILTLTGAAAIDATGNGLDNLLTGNAASNTMVGGLGADTLDGGLGADTMRGGGGNDVYVANAAGDRVIEATGAGIDTVQSTVTRTLEFGVEILTLTGAAAIDAIGNNLDNRLIGNGAANVLNGLAGNDVMVGQGGNDTLIGGGHADRFMFNTVLNAVDNVDTIQSYSLAADRIDLDNAVFFGLAGGFLAAPAFTTGAAATAAAHRIIYNDATGALIFDSNGNAAGGDTQFAILSSGLAMTNSEFFVI